MRGRESIASSLDILATGAGADRRRVAWRALAVVVAAALAWLVFAAYRQPDLLLDLAALNLC